MSKLAVLFAFLMSGMSVQAAVTPIRGPAEATVTVVVYGDFQCPFTKKGSENLALLVKEMPKDVKIAFKHFPLSFHEYAMEASKVGVCAQEQGLFWPVYDRLFALDYNSLNSERIAEVGKAAGLNADLLATCMAAPSTQQTVDRDIEEGVLLGVTGTPTFMLIGPSGVRRVGGAYPVEDLIKFIDEVR